MRWAATISPAISRSFAGDAETAAETPGEGVSAADSEQAAREWLDAKAATDAYEWKKHHPEGRDW